MTVKSVCRYALGGGHGSSCFDCGGSGTVEVTLAPGEREKIVRQAVEAMEHLRNRTRPEGMSFVGIDQWGGWPSHVMPEAQLLAALLPAACPPEGTSEA